MQGLFFEGDTGVRSVIRLIVVLIGFWTAWRSGKAAADGWALAAALTASSATACFWRPRSSFCITRCSTDLC